MRVLQPCGATVVARGGDGEKLIRPTSFRQRLLRARHSDQEVPIYRRQSLPFSTHLSFLASR